MEVRNNEDSLCGGARLRCQPATEERLPGRLITKFKSGVIRGQAHLLGFRLGLVALWVLTFIFTEFQGQKFTEGTSISNAAGHGYKLHEIRTPIFDCSTETRRPLGGYRNSVPDISACTINM